MKKLLSLTFVFTFSLTCFSQNYGYGKNTQTLEQRTYSSHPIGKMNDTISYSDLYIQVPPGHFYIGTIPTFLIYSEGNVCLCEPNPTTKLHVSGTIISSYKLKKTKP